MPKYYVRGKRVNRSAALQAWMKSPTYNNAAHREEIFWKAEKGIDDGGVTAHLAEAGIRVLPDATAGARRDD